MKNTTCCKQDSPRHAGGERLSDYYWYQQILQVAVLVLDMKVLLAIPNLDVVYSITKWLI